MLPRSGVQRQHYNKADGLERDSAKIGLSADAAKLYVHQHNVDKVGVEESRRTIGLSFAMPRDVSAQLWKQPANRSYVAFGTLNYTLHSYTYSPLRLR